MITIDRDKCLGDGLCVRICHEQCMTVSGGVVSINNQLCSTCAQCVAVCPQQALSWDGAPPEAFDRMRLPSPEQLNELFKERRSTRLFTHDKIDRILLQQIISYGIDAPTNNFQLRVVVVDDTELMAELDRSLMRYVSRVYGLVYRPRIVGMLARLIGLSRSYLLAKPKLEVALERGQALLSFPAAFVFIVGDKRVPLSEASTQAALCNMTYYAQVCGLASCLWGNGQLLCDRDRAVRKRLTLSRREHILGTLMLGYPAVKFRNKVAGKSLDIQWNNGL